MPSARPRRQSPPSCSPPPAGPTRLRPAGPEWSTPAGLSTCSATTAPRVIFPTEAPERPTGPGAIVWAAGSKCQGGAGARIDPISPTGIPRGPLAARSAEGTRLGPHVPIQAAAAPHGLIAIAGADPTGASRSLFIQGPAGGPFAPLSGARSARPLALANGYLGDLGILAAVPGAAGLSVELERWYAHRVQRRGLITGPHTVHPAAAALALDYRSDALAVWAGGGGLYARDEPGSGNHHRLQELGPAPGRPRIAALLSDDNRGIVLWVDHAAGHTRIYLDYSASGVRFGAPRLLESFADPDGQDPPGVAPADPAERRERHGRLARVRSRALGGARGADRPERAAHRQHDRRLRRGCPARRARAGPRRRGASSCGAQPLSGAGGQPEPGRQSLMAARGIETAPGEAHFGAAELVAPPGPVAGATLAVDPAQPARRRRMDRRTPHDPLVHQDHRGRRGRRLSLLGEAGRRRGLL